ncbi:hypothetical protein ABES25_04735 [Bacillus gobiensis]|uniref:hypothetical protein n=1 Tax=Bacillus gobiensis TaxID=1441095 RepID=UPI003D1C207C
MAAFSKPKTLGVLISGQKIPGLQEILKEKFSLRAGVFLAIIGLVCNLSGVDNYTKKVNISIQLLTVSLMGCLLIYFSLKVSDILSKRAYENAPVVTEETALEHGTLLIFDEEQNKAE